MAPPAPIFGGASIGDSYKTVSEVTVLSDIIKHAGIRQIDTAARYANTQSETLIGGAILPAIFDIDTKIWVETADGSGTLTTAAIEKSLLASLERLKVSQVNILYCHTYDPETPLLEQAAAFDSHFKKGRFKQLGISNFPVQMVEDLVAICKEHGYIAPTVYQGIYNIVQRTAETVLLPILRKHGIVFNAYSPLAGGFLTGKLTRGDVNGTRFADGNLAGMMYKPMYDKIEMHAAIRQLEGKIKTHHLTMTETGLRWIFYHAALHEGDGVILGASKPAYIEQNMAEIARGPLPDDVVATIEEVWEAVKRGSP